MKQGTTVPITLTIEGVDLTGADWVIVSLKCQDKSLIEIGQDQLAISCTDGDTTVVVALTQEQSLKLTPMVAVDCNWEINGVRGGAIPAMFRVTPTLLNRVVE